MAWWESALLCTGAAAVLNLPLATLSPHEQKIPPLAEQRRIVAKVEQRMAWVDALETQLANARTSVVTELTTNP